MFRMSPEADHRCAQLSELADCAYRLGVQLAAAAEAEADVPKKVELFERFHDAAASVRLSLALQMRLRRMPAEPRPALPRFRPEALEREAPERPDFHDPPDWEDRDLLRYTERDREADREHVSFPALRRTLQSLVAGAEALPGPEPADLPRLREFLATTGPGTSPASSGVGPRRGGGGAATGRAPEPGAALRDRLKASGSAQAQILARLPAKALGLRTHRPTGPPRR